MRLVVTVLVLAGASGIELPVSSWESSEPSTKACPWDPWKGYLLAIYPPFPTGGLNDVWLPNDAKPSMELSLTVAGEDDKYPYSVNEGGYGGRRVRCHMPIPARDNDAV